MDHLILVLPSSIRMESIVAQGVSTILNIFDSKICSCLTIHDIIGKCKLFNEENLLERI